MSSQPDHEEGEKNIVCECNNVCNRKIGRGSCVCLRNSRKCGRRCACGTEKMVCQNKGARIKQEVEEEEDKDDSTPDQEEAPQETASPQKIALFGRKRGRKRKSYNTGKSPDLSREWTPSKVQEDIPPSMKSWLVLGDVGNVVYCRYCRIQLIRKGNMVMLIQHGKSKKHERNALRWSQSARSLLGPLEDLEDIDNGDKRREARQSNGRKSLPTPAGDHTPDSAEPSRKRQKALRQSEKQEQELVVIATPVRGMSRKLAEEIEDVEGSGTEESDSQKAGPISAEEVSRQAREIKAAVVSFMVENNVPLDKTDPLVRFLKDLPSPGLAVERMTLRQEDAVDMMKQTKMDVTDDLLIVRLKTTLFSIVLDVQTDSAGVIYLVVFVFFNNEDLQAQLFCLDVVEIGDSSAETIHGELKEILGKREVEGVPLKNWMGLLCDTPNVPLGTMAGVVTLVKPDYPWVIPVVSLSYTPELSLIPVLKDVVPPELDQFCRLMNAHFLSGPELGVSYFDYRKFCEMKTHPIVADSDVPWVAAREFLSMTLDQWKHLQLYFRDVHQLRSAEQESANHDDDIRLILETLSDPVMKVWGYVVRFVNGLIKNHSSRIVQEEPFFQSIFRETVDLIRTFGNFFMTKDSVAGAGDLAGLDVDDPSCYLPLPEIYLGIEAAGALDAHMREHNFNLQDEGRMEFLQSVRELHKGIVRNLQARLELIRPAWQLGSLMNPQNLINHGSLALHNDEVLAPFKNAGSVDVEAVYKEIGALMDDAAVQTSALTSSPEDFWKYLLTSQKQACPNLQKVIMFFTSLPLTTTSVSRVVGQVKNWNVEAYLRLQASNVEEYLMGNVPIQSLMEGTSSSVVKA